MKRLAVLAVTVVALTSPALAQESVTATGGNREAGHHNLSVRHPRCNR